LIRTVVTRLILVWPSFKARVYLKSLTRLATLPDIFTPIKNIAKATAITRFPSPQPSKHVIVHGEGNETQVTRDSSGYARGEATLAKAADGSFRVSGRTKAGALGRPDLITKIKSLELISF